MGPNPTETNPLLKVAKVREDLTYEVTKASTVLGTAFITILRVDL